MSVASSEYSVYITLYMPRTACGSKSADVSFEKKTAEWHARVWRRLFSVCTCACVCGMPPTGVVGQASTIAGMRHKNSFSRLYKNQEMGSWFLSHQISRYGMYVCLSVGPWPWVALSSSNIP